MRFLSSHICRWLGFEQACKLIARLLPLLVIGLAQVQAQTVANALPQVNAVRVSLGLYALQGDPALQAQAEAESSVRAYRRITGHLPNGCSPGRAEGVGWSGGRDPYGHKFLTCYHSGGGGGRGLFRRGGGRDYTTKYRYAGAAVAVSPSGQSYYTLILK
jgi:hypothetical protein